MFDLLQCLLGLFRSAFNANNLKSLLGPNITLAEIFTSGFFGVFSRTIFHVLQSYTTQYKPLSPKKKRKQSVDSSTPHSQNELSLLHRKIGNFYQKFSSPVHKNSSRHRASTLPPPLFMNASYRRLFQIENKIFNHYIFTLYILINKNAHVVYHFQENLWRLNLTIRISGRTHFKSP